MESELNVDSLSEAFGFRVSARFEALIKEVLESSSDAPALAGSKTGLILGGPLFSFLGGSAQSLRCPQMPPEFFPFAVRRGTPDVYVGFLVDDPTPEGREQSLFAVLVPESPHRCGVIARNEQELTSWLSTYEEAPDDLGVERESPTYPATDIKAERESAISYRTADRFGTITPPENAPFSLLHEEFRCRLIEQRDWEKAREAGLAALRVEAPGAALALARDITWWLGHRDHWFQLATELYEGAYTQLERPLLTRIARREWARLYGRR